MVEMEPGGDGTVKTFLKFLGYFTAKYSQQCSQLLGEKSSLDKWCHLTHQYVGRGG